MSTEAKEGLSVAAKQMRVGNFKVLFTDVDGVPVIEVSNLEGTWLVRVPSHFQMYGMLNRLLLEVEDDDATIRSNAEEWLKMFFMNWQNATGIPSGHYHQAIVMLTGAYANPDLLKSSFFGIGKKFYADVKKLRMAFLKWAKEREKVLHAEEEAYDENKEAVADEAKDIAGIDVQGHAMDEEDDVI